VLAPCLPIGHLGHHERQPMTARDWHRQPSRGSGLNWAQRAVAEALVSRPDGGQSKAVVASGEPKWMVSTRYQASSRSWRERLPVARRGGQGRAIQRIDVFRSAVRAVSGVGDGRSLKGSDGDRVTVERRLCGAVWDVRPARPPNTGDGSAMLRRVRSPGPGGRPAACLARRGARVALRRRRLVRRVRGVLEPPTFATRRRSRSSRC
jgi:hypothetical protein